MKLDLMNWIGGRPVVAYGAGEYYDRAMQFGALTVDYFVDDEESGSEKAGRPVKPFTTLQAETRDVAVIIFDRRIGDAVLRLRHAGFIWREQVMDCRFFGVMNRYADDYVYCETFEDLCASDLVEVSLGVEATVEMNSIMLPVRRNAAIIRIRAGNGSQLKFCEGVLESGVELNVGGRGKLEMGDGSSIGEGSTISAATCSDVIFGDKTLISHASVVDAANQVGIYVGNECTFGWHLHLYAYAPIRIGDDMMASSYVYIESGAGHDLVIDGDRRFPQELMIGKHVWLGLKSTILAGSQLGDGCMVGAASLVNREFSECQLIAGNPARVIKEGIAWDRNYTAYKEQYHSGKENNNVRRN